MKCWDFHLSRSQARTVLFYNCATFLEEIPLFLLADTLPSGCVSVLVFTVQLSIARPDPTVSTSYRPAGTTALKDGISYTVSDVYKTGVMQFWTTAWFYEET